MVWSLTDAGVVQDFESLNTTGRGAGTDQGCCFSRQSW
eukprot:SAG11_NODE_7402_length_1149_cov_1.076190_2_plen_37_part_01